MLASFHRKVFNDDIMDTLLGSEFDSTPLRKASGVSISSEDHIDRNEDSYLIDQRHDVYGVFDGVGGHEGGQFASQTAMEVARRRSAEETGFGTLEDADIFLRFVLVEANATILRQNPEAATTAVLVKITDVDGIEYASIAHTGDSRAYIWREGVLTTLTTDHTPFRAPGHTQEAREQQDRLARVVDPSELSQESMKMFAQRNIIGACLGHDSTVKADIKHIAVQEGDVLIMTSDGVHDNLTPADMESILNATAGTNYAGALTYASYQRAREQGFRSKKDDITAVVVLI